MPRPVLLATWSVALPAVEAGWPRCPTDALGACEAACRWAESDLQNHTVGTGGWPDATGRVTLDAAVMLDPSRHGAVACVSDVEHPVSVARRVMEATPHRLLVGRGAEDFAREQGFPVHDPLTPEARVRWDAWRAGATAPKLANLEDAFAGDHDTIGAVALDQHGTLAAAVSTSGLAFKLAGRVGDSPIVGAGLYVVQAVGAVVCTGRGELVQGTLAAFAAVERMRNGGSPDDAVRLALDRVRNEASPDATDQLGVIALTPDGTWAAGALLPGFVVAVRDEDGARTFNAKVRGAASVAIGEDI